MYSNQHVDNMHATYEAIAARKDREIENLRQVVAAHRKEAEGHATQENKITDLMIQVTALKKERDAAREAATEARGNLTNALERATSAEAARRQMAELANGRASLVAKQTATLGLQNQEIARLLAEKQKARKLLRATRRFIKATL